MSIQIDNTNAGTLTLKPAASGSYTLTFPSAVAAVNGYVLSSDTSGTLSWVAGGGAGAEADTLATVTGRGATTATALSITNATASTAVGTGALLVSGGASIGGRLSLNGDLYSWGNGGGTSNLFTIGTYGDGAPGRSILIGAGTSYDSFSGGALTLRSGDADEHAGNVNITAGNAALYSGGSIVLQAGTGGTAGKVQITRTTASTSTTTGALTVAGGVGIAGAVYAGSIFSNGAEINTKAQTFIISMIFGGI